jgi:hypothetical protein
VIQTWTCCSYEQKSVTWSHSKRPHQQPSTTYFIYFCYTTYFYWTGAHAGAMGTGSGSVMPQCNATARRRVFDSKYLKQNEMCKRCGLKWEPPADRLVRGEASEFTEETARLERHCKPIWPH